MARLDSEGPRGRIVSYGWSNLQVSGSARAWRRKCKDTGAQRVTRFGNLRFFPQADVGKYLTVKVAERIVSGTRRGTLTVTDALLSPYDIKGP